MILILNWIWNWFCGLKLNHCGYKLRTYLLNIIRLIKDTYSLHSFNYKGIINTEQLFKIFHAGHWWFVCRYSPLLDQGIWSISASFCCRFPECSCARPHWYWWPPSTARCCTESKSLSASLERMPDHTSSIWLIQVDKIGKVSGILGLKCFLWSMRLSPKKSSIILRLEGVLVGMLVVKVVLPLRVLAILFEELGNHLADHVWGAGRPPCPCAPSCWLSATASSPPCSACAPR